MDEAILGMNASSRAELRACMTMLASRSTTVQKRSPYVVEASLTRLDRAMDERQMSNLEVLNRFATRVRNSNLERTSFENDQLPCLEEKQADIVSLNKFGYRTNLK